MLLAGCCLLPAACLPALSLLLLPALSLLLFEGYGEWLKTIIGFQIFRPYQDLAAAVREADAEMHQKMQIPALKLEARQAVDAAYQACRAAESVDQPGLVAARAAAILAASKYEQMCAAPSTESAEKEGGILAVESDAAAHVSTSYRVDVPSAVEALMCHKTIRDNVEFNKGTGAFTDPHRLLGYPFQDAARACEKSTAARGHLPFTTIALFLMNFVRPLLSSERSVIVLALWTGDDTYTDTIKFGNDVWQQLMLYSTVPFYVQSLGTCGWCILDILGTMDGKALPHAIGVQGSGAATHTICFISL